MTDSKTCYTVRFRTRFILDSRVRWCFEIVDQNGALVATNYTYSLFGRDYRTSARAEKVARKVVAKVDKETRKRAEKSAKNQPYNLKVCV